MSDKLIRCQNKECVWWEDYSCTNKVITIDREGICTKVIKKEIIKNNKK